MNAKKPPRATLEQRLKILDYHHKSRQPQSNTVERFRHEVAISSSSLSQWLKNEHEYRQRCSSADSAYQKQTRRKVTYKYDDINRAMDRLVAQLVARGAEVTEPVLRDHWQMCARRFGVDNPKRLASFSHGWLGQFKRRHGLLRPRDGGPPASPPPPAKSPPPARLSDANEQLSDANEQLLETNEQLLATTSEKLLAPPKLAPESAAAESAQFRPQESLSFPARFACLPGEKRPAAASAGPEPPAAADIERFLAEVADPFFRDDYAYPQTARAYHEFKTAFLSERYIHLRSAEEAVPAPLSPPPALQPRPPPPRRRSVAAANPALRAEPGPSLHDSHARAPPRRSHPVDFRSRHRAQYRSASFSPQPFKDRPPEGFTGILPETGAPKRGPPAAAGFKGVLPETRALYKVDGDLKEPEEGMDEIFSRQDIYKQDRKSASQKMWEQNKIMLS